MEKIYVAETKDRGRGVFANRFINSGEVIELAPALILAGSQEMDLWHTDLADYYYAWETFETKKELDTIAIVMGYGSFYNHSYDPNALYTRLHSTKEMMYSAIRGIMPHEEVLINYNGDPKSQEPVWFDVK